jgi:transposase
MSNKKAKVYSNEFKESSVKLALESKNTITQTARDLGIKLSTLHTWITKHSGSKAVKAANDDNNLHEELKRLKKEITQVTMERDILKKAAAYFAKQTL